MSRNSAPTAQDIMLQAKEKIRSSKSLHRRVLILQWLKIWAWQDDSASYEEEEDGVVLAPAVPAVGDGVGDGDAETSRRFDASNRAMPYVSEDEAGPPCKRRRLDDLPDEETLEPSPGHSGSRGNNCSAEDDTYPVRAPPLPDWLDVDGAVFEEPVEDPDLSFLDDL